MRAKGIYSLHFSNFENLKMNLEPYIVSIVWVLTTTFCSWNKISLKIVIVKVLLFFFNKYKNRISIIYNTVFT